MQQCIEAGSLKSNNILTSNNTCIFDNMTIKQYDICHVQTAELCSIYVLSQIVG